MRRTHSSNVRLLADFLAVAALAPAFAQTPQDTLKPGTVFTSESEDRMSGTKAQFVVRIDSVAPQVNATRTEAGQAPRPISDILRDVEAPLAVGKAWPHAYQFQRAFRGQWSDYKYDGKATVVSEETLTVAGRPLKTMRIDYRGWIVRIGGGPIGSHDLLIAAHARSLGVTLVTHNLREFARVPGLKTEDWLAAPA